MFKKLKIIALLLFLLFANIQITEARDNNKIIRVGIGTNDFSKYVYSSANFTATGTYEIIDSASGKIIPNINPQDNTCIKIKNGIFSVFKNDNLQITNLTGPLIVKTKNPDSFLSVKNLKRSGKEAIYRGVFEVTKRENDENSFCIVNALSLENYLRGVVPNEMPIRFGLEALKAQTIAARNYALRPRVKFYKEFDVCDSVACQVYFGAGTEKELSNLAIKETKGLVALSPEEELILALYSSTAGGYTESYEYTFSEPGTKDFPSKSISYLKAKPDTKDTPSLKDEESAKSFYLSYPESFDEKSPYFRWERNWNFNELEQALRKTLIEQSKTGFVKPKLENEKDFGALEKIEVIKRGDSGKVYEIRISTDKNKYTVSKELVIRRVFKKNGKALPSANFIIDELTTPINKKIIFHGGGFGHGSGMSQFGAGGMAEKGYTFDKILQHYYSGIAITTEPIILHTKENKSSADEVFFAPYKKAFLCINDKDKIAEITTVINNRIFKPELNSENDERKYKIDISEYIKEGLNTIIYSIPSSDNKDKSMRVYVELVEAKDE